MQVKKSEPGCVPDIKAGDFSLLAENYAKHRPGYSGSVLRAILGLLHVEIAASVCADVGAGTGIWTRMLNETGCKKVFAVEPNDNMREWGQTQSAGTRIEWKKGTAEATGLENSSVDLVSMASSLHWTNVPNALREFHTILRPQGLLVALWNPRLVERNPLLAGIEAALREEFGLTSRVSSGRSGITSTLKETILDSGLFEDVVYIEGEHSARITREHYLGAWESVNDVRAQLGEARFRDFLDLVSRRLKDDTSVEVSYLTRAWVSRRKE